VSPVPALTAIGTAAKCGPLAAALPCCEAAPRIAFRSLLLRQDTSPLHGSTGPQKGPAASRSAIAGQCGRHDAPRSSVGDPTTALAQQGPRGEEEDRLDPLERHRAALAPPDMLPLSAPVATPEPLVVDAPVRAAASNVRAAASLEDLIPALVRRIAWSGDRHRGTMRVELGAGELAGGTLLVHAEGGRVRVHLDAPPGVDILRWHQRICNRLASRGVATDGVEVT
jgi:hypothetical protein